MEWIFYLCGKSVFIFVYILENLYLLFCNLKIFIIVFGRKVYSFEMSGMVFW